METESMMKESVVLFPSLGKGHLIPMVELAMLFITRHNLSVTIVLVEPPFSALSTSDSFLSPISSAHPLLSFHRLPKPETAPMTSPSIFFEFFHQFNPLLSNFLQTLSQTTTIRALVLDMFCTAAVDVASQLNLPAYFFHTAAAFNLATFLFLPTLWSQHSDGRLKGVVEVPGVVPIPASHIPGPLLENNGEVFHFDRFLEAEGIMINTFEELEPRAVKGLVDGLCVPGRKMPPVYCVGPLIGTNWSEGAEERHECLKWLDEQPKRSVVFLCFGSMGSFSIEQTKEIAIGLERSGQRFLWVVRSPEPNLDMIMPEGFLERTAGRGMAVKTWAPQAAVLEHDSVGAFVTHCGWNSTLEAVSAGVPMVAWPLYAEQKMNKVFLVEAAKLAVEMKGYDAELVTADEVERKVKWVIESEEAKELTDKAMAMKESAVAAWEGEGSSSKAWMELMNVLRVVC